MTEDVVIDCTAIDRMAEEAARINRENRREIRRLQRVVNSCTTLGITLTSDGTSCQPTVRTKSRVTLSPAQFLSIMVL